MRSRNRADDQAADGRSFIEQARRAQIVEAAIQTLAEVGYGQASLAQIAKRAGISPSLISYHFADKDALMGQTLGDITDAWDVHVRRELASCTTAGEQLRRYIEASLGHMAARPAHFAALIEIAFGARTKDGQLLYRAADEEPELRLLQDVLERGQQSGEFRALDSRHVALAIRGAINEFFGGMHLPGRRADAYAADLADLFTRVVARL